ncbi:O-antigen ligase family protein [Schnuerera sp. xch1]|uniref:O-antigen ligase family protein n=1 Tax=Schnuerera sp. xch1 TaxID=2874283 RepID=UPI001CBF0F3C|nr:O-antigen ligase family protein [Schnuerera sp. xch1]MBZ2176033.1 O-antigen ligase family protein [Schnuerera sp. xch1]
MVVEHLKRKEMIFPIVLGVIFSLLYSRLSLEYFALILFGFIGIVLVLYDIRIGIFVGAFIFPFMPDMFNLLFMIFLVGVYVFKILFNKSNPLTKQNIDISIILYIIFILISTITSIDPTGSFRDLSIHFTSIGFLFVIVNSIHTKRDFNKLVVFLVISATLVAMYGFYQYTNGAIEMEDKWVDDTTNPDVQTRIYSVFGNPNIFAEYLIMIIPISLSLFWFSTKFHKKAIFLITSLILTLALILTMSRGGWVGFAFGIFVFLLLIEKRLLLLGIPVAIGGVFFLPPTILNRLMSIVNLADSSNSYRIRLWSITLDIIRDNWLVGVGFGHLPFKQTFETYIRTMPTYHSHNTYLETMAEMGILGFIVFVVFIFILYKYSIKRLVKGNDRYIKIMSAGLLSGLAAVLAQGLVENILYIPRIITTFWILVALILSLMRISDKPEEIG